MKNWYVFVGLFALVCALTFRILTFGTEDYVIVEVPGLRDGEIWQFECKLHEDESQAEFDARIDKAGEFFRASIVAAQKTASHEIVDAVRTKDGRTAVSQINAADRALKKAGIRIDRNLKILYDCEGI
ncbi:MAG: hypothetical protein HWE33_13085 [Rhodobacteraceae bacterium]|nr:hypothetical protein [Paracoccaceae bacterium]